MTASEQDPVARAAWRAEVAVLDPATFVFVDETSTSITLTRRYARAPRGERAVTAVPRNHGTATSLVAALAPAGLGAAMTLPGALDGAAFTVYVRDLLCPTLHPGQVVLFDNVSIHHGEAVRECIEHLVCDRRGIQVEQSNPRQTVDRVQIAKQPSEGAPFAAIDAVERRVL